MALNWPNWISIQLTGITVTFRYAYAQPVLPLPSICRPSIPIAPDVIPASSIVACVSLCSCWAVLARCRLGGGGGGPVPGRPDRAELFTLAADSSVPAGLHRCFEVTDRAAGTPRPVWVTPVSPSPPLLCTVPSPLHRPASLGTGRHRVWVRVANSSGLSQFPRKKHLWSRKRDPRLGGRMWPSVIFAGITNQLPFGTDRKLNNV